LEIDRRDVIEEVLAAFHSYERALMADDLDAMDALFWRSDKVVRYGIGENLYGEAEIRAFRQGRKGGSPQRELVRVAVAAFGGDFATVNAEFRRVGFDRLGRQSQTWARFDDGWKVVSAHLSFVGTTS
jgi:ketosteroid isomerase-like protein